MPINKKHKIAFIHIPKTGGTSIEETLGMCSLEHFWYPANILSVNGVETCLQHLRYVDLLHIYDKITEYFIFTIVRHPYDRTLSEYFFQLHDDNSIEGKFDEWLDRYCNFFGHDHYLPQTDFITENNEIVVNKVMYYENLDNEFRELCDKLGIPRIKLPISQKSKKRNDIQYNEFLTDEHKNKIYNAYQKDFEYLNYQS